MRLVDSSAWIEWLIGSPLGRKLAKAMPRPEEWLVPTIVQHELDEPDADRALAFSTMCFVADLDTEIVRAAANYCAQHKLATADAIVYATASAYGADLVTCDHLFQRLLGLVYFPKT